MMSQCKENEQNYSYRLEREQRWKAHKKIETYLFNLLVDLNAEIAGIRSDSITR